MRSSVTICIANAILLLVAAEAAFPQFTQGPPGNPSAAGITTGTPPPVPLGPRPVAPLPSTSLESGPTPMPYLFSRHEDGATEHRLKSEGLPPLLLTSPGSILARRLNLSQEQLKSIQEARIRLNRETKDAKYRLYQKRLEMEHLFADPQTSQNDLLKLHDEIITLNQKVYDATGRAGIEVRRILRADQLELLEWP